MAVMIDISMSVDGFIAQPDDASGPIHEWFFDGDTEQPGTDFFRTAGASTEVLAENLATTGATITGRRTYDLTNGWGGNHPVDAPVIVLCHSVPEDVPEGRTQFVFAHNISDAVAQAKDLAGDKDVCIMGGASVIQAALDARLVDEVQVHVAPVILGAGVRLIDHLGTQVQLEQVRVVEAPGVTHLRYRVTRAS